MSRWLLGWRRRRFMRTGERLGIPRPVLLGVLFHGVTIDFGKDRDNAR